MEGSRLESRSILVRSHTISFYSRIAASRAMQQLPNDSHCDVIADNSSYMPAGVSCESTAFRNADADSGKIEQLESLNGSAAR